MQVHSFGITETCYSALELLTCYPYDLCENIIGHLFSIFNGIDPLLDALSADRPDGFHRLSVQLCLEWMHVLQTNKCPYSQIL